MSGIYKCTFTHKKLGITKEQLAGKVLPHLIPLSIENNLNLNQVGTWLCCMLLHDKLVENRFKLLSEQNSYITVYLCLLWKQPNKTKKPASICVFKACYFSVELTVLIQNFKMNTITFQKQLGTNIITDQIKN